MSENRKVLTIITAVVIGLLAVAAVYFVLKEPQPALKPVPLPSNEELFHGPTYPPTITGPFTPPPSK